MSLPCPVCTAQMEWECARECAPNGISDSYFRCPDPDCDVVSVRVTGVDV